MFRFLNCVCSIVIFSHCISSKMLNSVFINSVAIIPSVRRKSWIWTSSRWAMTAPSKFDDYVSWKVSSQLTPSFSGIESIDRLDPKTAVLFRQALQTLAPAQSWSQLTSSGEEAQISRKDFSSVRVEESGKGQSAEELFNIFLSWAFAFSSCCIDMLTRCDTYIGTHLSPA